MLVRVFCKTARTVTVLHNGLQLLMSRSLLATILSFDAVVSQKQKAIKQEHTTL